MLRDELQKTKRKIAFLEKKNLFFKCKIKQGEFLFSYLKDKDLYFVRDNVSVYIGRVIDKYFQ